MKRSLLVLVLAGATAAFASGCGRQCQDARELVIEPTQQVLSVLVADPSGEALANEACGAIMAEMQHIPSGADTIRNIAADRYSHVRTSCARYESSVRYECTGYRRGYPYYPIFEALEEAEELEANLETVLDPTNRARPINRRPGGGTIVRRPGHPGGGTIIVHPRRPNPPPVVIVNPRPRPPVVVVPVRPVCRPYRYTYCAEWSYDAIREPGYAAAMELSRDLDLMYARAQSMCELARTGDTAGAYTVSKELLHFVQSEVKPEGLAVYNNACR